MSAKGAFNPKSIYEIMASAPKRNPRGGSLVSEREIQMLKAYSKKYKDRNVLINKTPFSFDSDGYCSVPDVSNARIDFELLLKMNHVYEVLDTPEISEQGAREEDTREGIDAPVLADEPAVEPEEAEELEEDFPEDLGLDEEPDEEESEDSDD